MPELTLNGKRLCFSEPEFPQTLQALILAQGLAIRAVVAEVDGAIVPREAFASHPLTPGATVELVQFVGGG